MDIDKMGERTVRAKLVTFAEKNQDAKYLAIIMAGIAIVAVYFLSLNNKEASKTPDAQKIYLQDPQGNMRADVELGNSGPEIGLLDGDAAQRVSFKVEDSQSLIVLKDENGIGRLTLAGGKAMPVLSVFGDTGNALVSLNLANIGPDFGFSGASAKLNFRPFEQEGKTGIRLIDASNNPRVVMEEAAATTSLSFLNDAGQVNTLIQVAPSGVSLSLLDVNNLVRAQCTIVKNQMTVAFYDSLGRKRAELLPEGNENQLVFFDDKAVAREALLLGKEAASLKLLDFETPSVAVATGVVEATKEGK